MVRQTRAGYRDGGSHIFFLGVVPQDAGSSRSGRDAGRPLFTSMLFERTLPIGWEHLDVNGHMRNTAYLDLAVNVRMAFFNANGFPVSEFRRLHVGPVVQRDDIQYFRECHMLEEIRGTLAVAGLSEDASRFRLRNEFYKSDGRLAARLRSDGGWLDLSARRLCVPPDSIRDALSLLDRTDDFEVLKPLEPRA